MARDTTSWECWDIRTQGLAVRASACGQDSVPIGKQSGTSLQERRWGGE